MKININVTIELTDEQVMILTEIGKMSGHNFDKVKSKRKIIKRLLVSQVEDKVTYCHEEWREM